MPVEDYDEDDESSGMAQDREEGELIPASKRTPTKAKTKAKEVTRIGPPSKKRKRPAEVEDPHDSAASDATPTPASPKSSKSTTVNKSRLAGIRKATQPLQARPGE
ncbi:hypothetical protein D9756_010584 [Leucocoprinus leucothites]|uniref:Uncharacterized protein n=1 Tax=Leucocoprinus leucothites TaxID=201217 RepID=A0A8H5CS27_9AGAR|nr:hypothetical protein D9756_010584 [Leucoagaricus leucothites]